jgi:DNA-3-methyladenine glycosylase
MDSHDGGATAFRLSRARRWFSAKKRATGNVSSEIAGIGTGVLIRALEPRDGIPIMQRNRRIERLRDLARGPGRLTAALRVDRRFDELDLCREGPLWLGRCDHERGEIGQSTRIGITRDMDRLL